MNFLLLEMTFLRYFMPMVLEGNKKGIKSRFFLFPNVKYTNVFKHIDTLEDIAKKYNIELYPLEDVAKHPGTTFTIENVGGHMLDSEKHTSVAITYMTDYTLSYKKYISKVDHVVMPNKYFAEYYGLENEKNLYLGSPKYDTPLNKQEILDKYNIPDTKNALIIYPKRRDVHRVDIGKIKEYVSKMGYRALIKTRGKDPMLESHKNTFSFEDTSWYPHTTIELIKISDFIINFCSTTIKESVMLNTPIINFDIKPAERHGIRFNEKDRIGLRFLYEYRYCKELDVKVGFEEFKESVDCLIDSDLSQSYEDARRKYLFEGNSSKRIIEHFFG